MDTKWKSIKRVLSFLIFFLGVSLTLWNLSGLLRRMPEGISSWKSGKLLADDYQQGREFQNHITNRLESFLSIAVNGCPAGWEYYDYYDEGGYYDYGWDTTYSYSIDNGDTAENMAQSMEAAIESYEYTLAVGGDYWENQDFWENYGVYDYEDYEEYLEEYEDLVEDYQRHMQEVAMNESLAGAWEGSGNWYWTEHRQELTEEQKERRAQQMERMTQMYFHNIEEDKNLLYSISCDGKLMYTNSDLLVADGSMQAPEGYNFLLYFDGEKVRIMKDGKELDIYGDGYYRDGDNDWYVPGYRNFPASDDMKKVAICMAAAKEPVLYTTGIDQSGGYRQQNNALYWMQYYNMRSWKLLRWNLMGFAAGLALLFFSCLCRKGRLEALEKIASLQGKIWVECKVLILVVLLATGVNRYFGDGCYGYNIWWEFSYAGDVIYEGGTGGVAETLGEYGGAILTSLLYMPLFLVLLFWAVYLTVNDFRHNKKVWRQGLVAKVCHAYSVRGLKLPLARRMIRRNAVLFGVIAVSGVLMLIGTLNFVHGYRGYLKSYEIGAIFLWCLLITGCMLAAVYLMGKKNMEAARDMDEMSDRISEICNGNYSGNYGFASADDNGVQYAGRELGDTMAQLENIRQGMASAVDEQMKSERMKVELIANVSHDIKTPLTSIISYVQFLKDEKDLPEHVRDYVNILDEKSQRLKNMVQDVFAVSKAASGELPMNMERLDFGKLLRQTMADMDEEIQNSSVSFRTELPEEPVMIMADGQRMYRVFQNLFQNALKYSLAGSRVYVTLKTDGTLAVASVKNTSHMELDEDKDFTERFVRGDKSRTDGGSGLGLSIAQSFTEACGGQFGMEFNADLFIVNISFQISM